MLVACRAGSRQTAGSRQCERCDEERPSLGYNSHEVGMTTARSYCVALRKVSVFPVGKMRSNTGRCSFLPGIWLPPSTLAVGVASNRAIATRDQCGRSSSLCHRDYGTEAGRRVGKRCRCRPSPYMNNVLEQDCRFIKKRVAASLWFRSVDGALNTIAGYESMHMIRKGQIRWLAKVDVVGQIRLIRQIYGIAA